MSFGRSTVLVCAALVLAGCGGSTSGGSGGSTSGGSGGAMTGGSGGATSGGGGAAGSAGSGGTATVSCGGFSATMECQAQEFCCDSQCVAEGTPCSGFAFHCDDASDCPGGFCCATKLSMLDGGTQIAQCQTTCDPSTQLVVCKQPMSSGGCPTGMTCEITATLPPTYGYCCPSGQMCSAT